MPKYSCTNKTSKDFMFVDSQEPAGKNHSVAALTKQIMAISDVEDNVIKLQLDKVVLENAPNFTYELAKPDELMEYLNEDGSVRPDKELLPEQLQVKYPNATAPEILKMYEGIPIVELRRRYPHASPAELGLSPDSTEFLPPPLPPTNVPMTPEERLYREALVSGSPPANPIAHSEATDPRHPAYKSYVPGTLPPGTVITDPRDPNYVPGLIPLGGTQPLDPDHKLPRQPTREEEKQAKAEEKRQGSETQEERTNKQEEKRLHEAAQKSQETQDAKADKLEEKRLHEAAHEFAAADEKPPHTGGRHQKKT